MHKGPYNLTWQETWRNDATWLVLARTIYIRCIYSIFGREITKYTVIYGVYIRFWLANPKNNGAVVWCCCRHWAVRKYANACCGCYAFCNTGPLVLCCCANEVCNNCAGVVRMQCLHLRKGGISCRHPCCHCTTASAIAHTTITHVHVSYLGPWKVVQCVLMAVCAHGSVCSWQCFAVVTSWLRCISGWHLALGHSMLDVL
jgi:hypothetical protein